MKRKPNVELLKKTLRYIERHPKKWDQAWFRRCGTTCCFAGHAAILGGSEWKWPESESNSLVKKNRSYPEEDVSRRAQRLLGLSFNEANRLFNPENRLTQLRLIVRQLCEQ